MINSIRFRKNIDGSKTLQYNEPSAVRGGYGDWKDVPTEQDFDSGGEPDITRMTAEEKIARLTKLKRELDEVIDNEIVWQLLDSNAVLQQKVNLLESALAKKSAS